jgi:hypothetical protein
MLKRTNRKKTVAGAVNVRHAQLVLDAGARFSKPVDRAALLAKTTDLRPEG